jgi:uncharacterized membrane protein
MDMTPRRGQGNKLPTILLTLAGLVIGASGGFAGAVIGALIGFAIGTLIGRSDRVLTLENRVHRLDLEVGELKARMAALEARPAQLHHTEAASLPLPSTALAAEAPPPVGAQEETETPAPAQKDMERRPAIPATSTETWLTEAKLAEDSPQPASPAMPAEPFERFEIEAPRLPGFKPFAMAKAWLLGGNTLVRAGAVVLFFGLAFLVKFAAEHTTVPIEFRYIGIVLAALVLLGLGWRLRQKRPGFAMALQGLAVAILYLTVFAAYRLHGLLPAGLAFGLLLGVAALSAVLAILQDALAMAVIGICGGFLAPVLASTGGGSHVGLFSYYALLNAGILGIAWFKAWRPLNVLGFLFTFGIGSAWGWHNYHDDLFATTEPFLLLFFFLYLAISLLYARRRKQEIARFGALTLAGERIDYVDATLVFGTPLAAFGLQYLMLRHTPYGSALSALALGAIYLPLAMLLYRRGREEMRLLVESFLALGVVFASLAVPLGLDAQWTAASWAIEGAGILWVGLRQGRRVAQAFGLLLQIGAGLALGRELNDGYWLSALLISAAGFVSGLSLYRADARQGEGGAVLASADTWSGLCLAWSLSWWWHTGTTEIGRHIVGFGLAAHILFASGSAALLLLSRRLLHWPATGVASALLLPLSVMFAIAALMTLPHPAAHYGWLAWPLAMAMLARVLRRQEGGPLAHWLEGGHTVSLWLVAGLTTWQTWWWFRELGDPGSAWHVLGWALSPLILLALLNRPALRTHWPLAAFPRAYGIGAAPIALGLWAWVFFANGASDGSAAPLRYVPLANPIDLANAGALLVLLAWLRRVLAEAGLNSPRSLRWVAAGLGATAFVWMNGILLRSLHHWAAVPFDLGAMLASTLVQAALSLFWALLALSLMLLATRRGWRPVWLTGAGLMAAVVAKLFLVDLSRVGSIERIVSFIGVGLLLLVLGYFSPVPPRRGENE